MAYYLTVYCGFTVYMSTYMSPMWTTYIRKHCKINEKLKKIFLNPLEGLQFLYP